MSKYNYFDDDPNELIPKKSKKLNINKVKNGIEDFVHGNAFESVKLIRELPNLRIKFFKLMAFVLFVVAIFGFIIAFSHTISSQNKKLDKFYTDAGNVCTNCITDYGVTKWEPLDSDEYGSGMARLTGLCYARQMDFDNDGSSELMICYNNKNIYYLEVWGYHGKEFVKFYSEEANSSDDILDGSWISFFHKNNKYYICKSAPEDPSKVEILALKGDTFKKDSSVDYDYKNNIYSIKGKINATDFETIKLSVIKTSKAEVIVETVSENIESFSNVSISTMITKTDEELKNEAYYNVIESRNEKYGKASIEDGPDGKYINGLAVVDLVDFDGDGNDELMIIYRKLVKESATNYYTGDYITIEKPTYCMEVYSWNGSVATKVFSRDSISNYLNDSSVNYVLLKTSSDSTEICFNSYSYTDSYNYSASSRIFKYTDNEFESIFFARRETSYGYNSYYIDGERVYNSTFDEHAYQVPKFLNDDETYDENSYKFYYVAGSIDGNFDATISSTIKTIESINKNYDSND